ncbi:hypothetical protein KSP39_PZI011336 [Platanthera zijinensis]|uniref:DNA polymerase V n=1 Tax=Platanthera zijinensis TaxID=2320716 RepID=A0AAP0G5L2_9ASPA
MVSKKRHFSAIQESDGEEKRIETSKFGMKINTNKCNVENIISSQSQSMNPMSQIRPPSPTTSLRPGIHLDLLLHLASANSFVREAAAEMLVTESIEVQKAYEDLENRVEDEGNLLLEGEKDDGLEDCAPSLRLLVSRLILGASSTRECARQGFSLGLAVVLEKITAVKVESVMRLIIKKLNIPSGMKGQEARDLLLGRLFTYGSLARSHRLFSKWISDKNTHVITEFTSTLISLAQKKRYLHEPAIAVILNMLEKLPLEAIERHVLIAPGMQEWLQKAVETGDPDALFFALKLQEMVPMKRETFNKLLPHPFNIENFFSRENLQILGKCFKESTFCLPRIHSIWSFLVNMLIPDGRSQHDVEIHSNKKSRKCNSSEDIIKNIRCFCEVVIEGTLLQSSHDRKHLALNILQLLLPRLPSSTIDSVLPHKLVQCLMDILSTKNTWLYNTAQLFMNDLLNWAVLEDERHAAVIVSLQKYSNGRFDCVTRTNTVRELVAEFKTAQGCMQFVNSLMNLFVDEVAITGEPSDQSQTTDENSEIGSAEDKGSLVVSGNTELLKIWVIDSMPRLLKNLKVDLRVGSSNSTEEKFKIQTRIAKFLAVQGLFSASLGTEVTSFQLLEKFQWPRVTSSSSLCKMCIEQLQLLLEDAQKEESVSFANSLERNDLGSFFMCFLKTLGEIPSVSLYRTLSKEDEKAFSRLQEVEFRLYQEERDIGPGLLANKLHAMRYLLIQLVLQILLHPNDFSEAASDLIICCNKLFPSTADNDSEDAFDDNDMPKLMDVLVETLLSILPRSSGRMSYVVEQVFRFFCSDITDYGLQRMLRVVKKDLKPLRHPVSSDDDEENDEDDEVLGIEDTEMDETKAGEVSAHEENEDHSDEMANAGETTSSSEDESVGGELAGTEHELNVRKSGDNPRKSVKPVGDKARDTDSEDFDDSDGGMDDDAMFRMDAYHAQLLKERTGNDNALSQLILFKLRVLSLLEIYLQKYPGKSHVLAISSCFVQTYSKYHGVGGNEQLCQRIIAILKKKVFKGKDHPRGGDIALDTLEKLLGRSLKTASRSRVKDISSLAQAYAFWLLKIISSRNFPESELGRVALIVENVLLDYFNNRNCRLKSGFIKEIMKRHGWLGLKLFAFLLDKCANGKSEFRRIEAVDMVDCIIKSVIPSGKGERDKETTRKSSKLLKVQLPVLCEVILQLLNNLPGKQSRRAEVRRFCTRALEAVAALNLKKSFVKAMMPDGISVCESKLGNAVAPFKAL